MANGPLVTRARRRSPPCRAPESSRPLAREHTDACVVSVDRPRARTVRLEWPDLAKVVLERIDRDRDPLRCRLRQPTESRRVAAGCRRPHRHRPPAGRPRARDRAATSTRARAKSRELHRLRNAFPQRTPARHEIALSTQLVPEPVDKPSMISEHRTMSWWRVSLLVAALVSGCTKPNPKSCRDGTCTDPALPFCDVDGALSGEPETCIAVSCTPGEFTACRGDLAITCNGAGTDYDLLQCERGCDETVGGCRMCTPNETVCSNGRVSTCDANGNLTESVDARLAASRVSRGVESSIRRTISTSTSHSRRMHQSSTTPS